MNQSIRSYVAEFIGTFTLVFVGTAVATLSGLIDKGPAGWLGISLAFGLTLAVLVLVIGPISGCHVNPAVTLGVTLAKRMKWQQALGYILSQCLGAIAASGILLALLNGIEGYAADTHGLGANAVPAGTATSTILGLEFILTALFVWTILTVTRGDAAMHNSRSPGFAAIAIGGMLLVIHLIGVPLGDASVNPARSLGPALILGSDAVLDSLWVFIVGPLLGGVVGMVFYRIFYED